MRVNCPLLRIAACVLLTWSWRDARADDTHDCIVASKDGQLLRDDRKPVEAVARFAVCARTVCPQPVRKACLRWSAEVSTAVSTVVLAARDVTGRDLLQVRVRVDGKLVAEQLDGGPIAEDPGPHVFRFEPPDGTAVEENVILHEGERNRLVSVVLGATTTGSSSAPTTASSGGPTPAPDAGVAASRPLLPTASWVLGAVGVGALGGFAYFGLTGQAQRNMLGPCAGAHNCNPNDVGSTRTDLIAADVFLGIGVVALAAATYFALVRPSASRSVVAVGPARGGGVALWQGAF
jgi:hypothetical protein